MKTVNEVRNELRKLNHPMFTAMADKFQDSTMKEILNNYNELKPLWEATCSVNNDKSVFIAEKWFSTHLEVQRQLHGSLSRPLIIMNYTTAKLIGGSLSVAAEKILIK
jgi:hypothetical protein